MKVKKDGPVNDAFIPPFSREYQAMQHLGYSPHAGDNLRCSSLGIAPADCVQTSRRATAALWPVVGAASPHKGLRTVRFGACASNRMSGHVRGMAQTCLVSGPKRAKEGKEGGGRGFE
uniref:Uncharacterized protein n=1 Tax=Eutreptiella gymnastica TaxID=73025 RepID=A0A7S4FRA8_9EUGL|mmetsp:Transcript_88414/g.147508  ORF Transcript_88414/g.147508 Transcript_88414/m.147508 type:complete len:118 (-) Transcript_88414:286-639(-)